jgi:hypothetical protein
MLIAARMLRKSRRLRSILEKMELTRPALCALVFGGNTEHATMAVKTIARPSVKYLFMQTPSEIRGNSISARLKIRPIIKKAYSMSTS